MLEFSATGLENLTTIFRPPRTELITWRSNLILKLFGGHCWISCATALSCETACPGFGRSKSSHLVELGWNTKNALDAASYSLASWRLNSSRRTHLAFCCLLEGCGPKQKLLLVGSFWGTTFALSISKLRALSDIFGELKGYGPVFHDLRHLIFKNRFKALVGTINWF